MIFPEWLVAEGVLDVLRILGEMVGITGPVPRLAYLNDGFLIPTPGVLEFLA